jgi:hypothetical protein
MRKAVFAIFAVAMLVFAGAAMAGKVGQVKPFVWAENPSETSLAVAEWTKEGLSLQKNTATATVVMAGAEIKGVAGEELEGDEVGVDPGAFESTMTGIDIVLDETGQTLLRNISVNNVTIDK